MGPEPPPLEGLAGGSGLSPLVGLQAEEARLEGVSYRRPGARPNTKVTSLRSPASHGQDWVAPEPSYPYRPAVSLILGRVILEDQSFGCTNTGDS